MATHAVVLMGPQAPGALRKAMRRVGVEVRRLSDAAAEVHLDEEPALKATEQLSAHEAFDVACLPLEGREKKMLIADMDSTMVAEETLDELAAAFGFGEQVRGITDLSMRGELNFEEALRRRVGLLYGVAIDNALDTIRKRTTVNPGADILVQTMRTRGAHTALVTGGFDVFAGPIGGEIGFKDTYANRLRSVDGVLTGEVAEPILGPDAKAERLALLCQEHDLSADDVVAVGDGANDCKMIEAAGLGVGYRPKPIVERVADVTLKCADLTALLALQGIPDSEWLRPRKVSS